MLGSVTVLVGSARLGTAVTGRRTRPPGL